MSLSPDSNLYAAWREADAHARAAESFVLTASLRALERMGKPPTLEERARAKALRERANTVLELAFKQAVTFGRPPASATPESIGAKRADGHTDGHSNEQSTPVPRAPHARAGE